MPDSVPIAKLAGVLRVKPGSKVRLKDFDAGQTYGHDKAGAKATEADLESRLASLQERLWAEAKHPVLIVLQGIDAAGKDGTIRKVMDAFNPQGCQVVGFKVPTPLELSHDYLWRVHPHAPAKGSISIFNRSHYEDVLVVRVHDFVPEAVWRRYGQINDWERMLTDEGTTILKFFLCIDRDEQKARFEARRDDPTKNWKFSTGDLPERALWDRYIEEAFEECLERTSTAAAPWYLIPANKKWFRDLAVSRVVAETLEGLDPHYPPIEPGSQQLVVD